MLGRHGNTLVVSLALATLGVTLGCNQRAGAANRAAYQEGDTTAATASANGDWTDAKILRAAVTANSIDSAMGAFALEMTQLPAVKEFAQTMIRDHGGANKLATELGKRADIPFDSVHIIDDDPKAKLVRESLDQMNEMRKLQGAEFDKGYLQREVEFHEDVLKDLDDDLIPNAKNAELRGFLEQIRPTVSSHLERAKQLKDELDRGAVPAGTQP